MSSMLKYIDQSFEITSPLTPEIGAAMVMNIEQAARICYQSKSKNTGEIEERLIHKLLRNGHMSMMEHGYVQVKIVTSRAIANELVRHRMASYAQSSTRYIRYNKQTDIIMGAGWSERTAEHYDRAYRASLDAYHMLLSEGVAPELARDVLPLALATVILVTANLREWMHIFKQRTDPAAHPDMVRLMSGILSEFRGKIPIIFEEKYRNNWA